tara:strand:- start:92 stop:1831 length:1740 start_codon:yes stop_codon:yes gene_type:complete
MSYTLSFSELLNSEVICSPERVLINHANIRAGKSQFFVKSASVHCDHGGVPLIATYDSTSCLDDLKAKAINDGWKDDHIIFLNKDKNIAPFMRKLEGSLDTNLLFLMNGNGAHYNRLFKEIEFGSGLKAKNMLVQMEDEGHWGRAKVEAFSTIAQSMAGRRANMLKLRALTNSFLSLSSATLDEDAYGIDYLRRQNIITDVNLLKTSTPYVDPLSSKVLNITRDESYDLRVRGLLSPSMISEIKKGEKLPKDLVLINGVFETNKHEKIAQRLASILPKSKKFCVLIIHKGKLIEHNCADSTINMRKFMDVRDVQSAIHYLHHVDGYTHIYCVGHKQAEMGQTFSDFKRSLYLRLQIISVSVPKNPEKPSEYRMHRKSLGQWNRAGGYTVLDDQTTMTVEDVWVDYKSATEQFLKNIQAHVLDNKKQDFKQDAYKNLNTSIPDVAKNVKDLFGDKPPRISAFAFWEDLPFEKPKAMKDVRKLQGKIKSKHFGKDFFEKYFDGLTPVSTKNVRANIPPIHTGKADKLSHTNKKHGAIQMLTGGIRIITEYVGRDDPHTYHNHDGDLITKAPIVSVTYDVSN